MPRTTSVLQGHEARGTGRQKGHVKVGDMRTCDTQTLGASEHGGCTATRDVWDMQDRQTEDRWTQDTQTGDHKGHTDMKDT